MRDARIEIYDFIDFDDALMKSNGFQDLRDSCNNSNILLIFVILKWNFKILMIFIILKINLKVLHFLLILDSDSLIKCYEFQVFYDYRMEF